MSNENSSAAQNKMGELFVDIGTSGLGKTVKGLNSLNASFLLAKKGAEEFIKPIKEVMKHGMNSAIQWSKMSTSLGATPRQIQSMQAFFKKNNLDQGLFDDIAKMQAKLYDLHHGLAAMDSGMAISLNRLNMDISDYEPTLEGTLKYIDDIRKRTKAKNYSPQDVQSILRQNQLSGEWAYAFQKGDYALADSLTLSDEEIDALIGASEELNELNNNIDQLKNKGAAKVAPFINDAAKGTNKLLENSKDLKGFYKNLTDDQKKELKKSAIDVAKYSGTGSLIGGAIGLIGGPVGVAAGVAIGGSVGSYMAYKKVKDKKGGNNDKPTKTIESKDWVLPKNQYRNGTIEEFQSKQIKEIPMSSKQEDAYNGNDLMPALPKHLRETSYLPSALRFNTPLDMLPSQTTKSMFNDVSVVINNENKISSTDPQKAAQEIGSINTSEIEHSISLAFVQNSQQELIS